MDGIDRLSVKVSTSEFNFLRLQFLNRSGPKGPRLSESSSSPCLANLASVRSGAWLNPSSAEASSTDSLFSQTKVLANMR